MKKLNNLTKLTKNQISELLNNGEISKSEKMRTLFNAGHDSVAIAKMLNVRTNFTYNIINQYVMQLELAGQKVELERKRQENTVKARVLQLLTQNPDLTNKQLQLQLKILYPNQIYNARKKLLQEGLINK